MQCQILAPAASQGIYRGIVPDIGTVAAVPAKLDHIEMGRGSDPVDKNQLMLGSIQRSHSCIRLVPDTQVQLFAIDRAADGGVVHVTPVHADEVDRTVARNTRRGAQRIGQEGTELCLAHLTRGHRELSMASGGNRMSSDSHVVGRIEKSRIDACPAADDPLQEFDVPAAATSHPVISKNPDVAQLRSWC